MRNKTQKILAGVGAIAFALALFGFTQNSTSMWIKGIIYAGTSKVALTDATGTLSFSAATSLTTSITAYATGGQANGTAITSDYNIVTVCATAGDSVTLPAAAAGREMTVFNHGAAALAVFPGSGDIINGGSANASVTVPVNGVAVFRGESASAWKVSGGYWVQGGLEFTGATATNVVTVPDNLADAFNIKEGSSSYIKLTSTNSSERVTVTPAMTITGQLTQAAPPLISTAAAVSAAGSSKTDATALTLEYSTITGTALQGVSLLTAAVGLHMSVYNDSAVSLVVYPLDAGDDTLAVNDFAALAADAGWVVAPRGKLDCTAYTTTAWHCTYTQGAKATVAAAGTNQSNCTALTSVNLNATVTVTGADGTVSLCLPTGTYPGCITVFSSAITSVLNVYGNASDDDTIAGAAADAIFVQTARSRVTYCTVNGIAWLTY